MITFKILVTETFFNTSFISKNQKITSALLKKKGVELYLKREDEIHPHVSGNKFRKLKYNIAEAKKQHKTTLLTFGGAFSNHIVATAVAGKLAGFKTIGIVRGDELKNNFNETLKNNATLQKAHENGMFLEFVSRYEYREKSTRAYQEKLTQQFGDFYLIPEGGTNNLAIKGCEEILSEEDLKFDYICCAVGTGGTISGLINASVEKQQIVGFPALKGNFLENEVSLFAKKENWVLQKDYHFGGYAKYNDELIAFINNFKQQTNILLDPIYTGKMLFGILDLIEKNHFKEGSTILAIHTGGIQGIVGINNKLKKKNKAIIQL